MIIRSGYRMLQQGWGIRRIGSLVRISPEVTTAIAEKRPVVALESTIITHGRANAKALT
jgi:pseudouridine-5'-phosphate glycosidase